MSTLGKPAPPKPEIKTVEPSATSATACAAVLTRLSIAMALPRVSCSKAEPANRGRPPPAKAPLDLRLDQFDDAAHVEVTVAVRDMHGIGCGSGGPQRRCRARHLRRRLRQAQVLQHQFGGKARLEAMARRSR